ncbi:MAG: hypothetical protein HFJ09_08835 [Lachnospiraceae bacterium]|nr:hypothetical protein [Lachnospiraceae bacterium]
MNKNENTIYGTLVLLWKPLKGNKIRRLDKLKSLIKEKNKKKAYTQ